VQEPFVFLDGASGQAAIDDLPAQGREVGLQIFSELVNGQ
jgi:hypothetical protein